MQQPHTRGQRLLIRKSIPIKYNMGLKIDFANCSIDYRNKNNSNVTRLS